MNNDLTGGIIWKKLLFFFLPVFAGSLFQQFYITADALITGRFAGKSALAAIDGVYSLIKFPVNFFSGIQAGAAIIISRYFGARDEDRLSRAVHTALLFALSGGLVLSALGISLSPLFLKVLNIPDAIYGSALAYIRIYFAGMALSMTCNVCAGILRALGQSRIPFAVLTAANAVNILLDLLFVGLFRWGVSGAAFATVLSQLLSAVLALGALLKTELPCRLIGKKIRFHKTALQEIFRLGLPLGIQSSLFPAANMMIQAGINSFGVDSIAAWAVTGKLDLLVWLVSDSLGSTASTFTAQNHGAGLYARARRGTGVCLGMALGIVLSISAVLYFFCGPLSRLFVNDGGVIKICVSLTRFLAPFYFCYAGAEVLSGAICGTGETFKPMLLTLLGTCACRAAWVLFAVPLRPVLSTVIWSYPVSWITTLGLFVLFYRLHRGKKGRDYKPPAPVSP